MRDSKRPFRYLVIGWLVVVLVCTAIALLRPSPVLSDVDLTQAVNSAFLPRTEDPALHDLAHQRAQYQVTYSGGVCLDSGSITHDGMTTTEVVACNQAVPDPIGAAVQQWVNSAPHAAILGDSRYNLIGCASATAGTSWFFVCVLGVASPSQPVVPAPPAEVPYVPSPTSPPVVVLPNTALETPQCATELSRLSPTSACRSTIPSGTRFGERLGSAVAPARPAHADTTTSIPSMS